MVTTMPSPVFPGALPSPGHALLGTVLLISLILLAGAPALAVDIGPQVAVSSYRLDPQVLMKGDTGVVTVNVMNSGTDSVFVNSARLSGGAEVSVIQSPDETQGGIVAGGTVTYVYKVRAEGGDGVYYLRFALDFRDGGGYTLSIPVQVDSSTLGLTLLETPDLIVQGVKGDYLVMVGNPRPDDVTAVTVTPEGDGFLVTPSGVFLGALAPDSSSVVAFNVTPLRQTFIRFRVNFKNGINPHTTTLTIPLATVENRMQADPVITNIRVTTEQGAIQVSGDVSNVGLEAARSVTVTSQGDVTPVDPYKVYVVGTLEPDDVASFEVTFRSKAAVSSVPLLVTYKDQAGNILTSTSDVEISSQAISDQASEPSRFTNLLVWMFVILVAAVFIYFWRRG
ncbi:MAG TPA: hypothetical protein VEI51_03335 [Methanomicrobiales archaeon]|nr:hypothetical protein [Methanomicrobiales archaeon]